MKRKNIEIKHVKEFLNEIGFNWDGTYCSFDCLHRREATNFEQLISTKDFALLFDNKDHVGYFAFNDKLCKRFKYIGGETYEILADYSTKWKNYAKKVTSKSVEITK